jgi:hypothetical protein
MITLFRPLFLLVLGLFGEFGQFAADARFVRGSLFDPKTLFSIFARSDRTSPDRSPAFLRHFLIRMAYRYGFGLKFQQKGRKR